MMPMPVPHHLRALYNTVKHHLFMSTVNFPNRDLYFTKSHTLETTLKLLIHLNPQEQLVLGPVRLYKAQGFVDEFMIADFHDKDLVALGQPPAESVCAFCHVEQLWSELLSLPPDAPVVVLTMMSVGDGLDAESAVMCPNARPAQSKKGRNEVSSNASSPSLCHPHPSDN